MSESEVAQPEVPHNLNTKTPCLLLSDFTSRLSGTVQTLSGVRFPLTIEKTWEGRDSVSAGQGTTVVL